MAGWRWHRGAGASRPPHVKDAGDQSRISGVCCRRRPRARRPSMRLSRIELPFMQGTIPLGGLMSRGASTRTGAPVCRRNASLLEPQESLQRGGTEPSDDQAGPQEPGAPISPGSARTSGHGKQMPAFLRHVWQRRSAAHICTERAPSGQIMAQKPHPEHFSRLTRASLSVTSTALQRIWAHCPQPVHSISSTTE
jgi:hypothetical protein